MLAVCEAEDRASVFAFVFETQHPAFVKICLCEARRTEPKKRASEGAVRRPLPARCFEY